MQHALWLLVALYTQGSKICGECNRFLLRGFQYGGAAESTPALSPSLSWEQELLLLPKRLQAKTMPRGSPFPYLSFLELKLATQTDLRPLCNVRLCVLELPSSRGSSLFQGLGCAALGLHGMSRDPHAVPRWIRVSPRRDPSEACSQHGTLPPGVGFPPCRA